MNWAFDEYTRKEMIVENKQDFNESRVSSNPNAIIYHIFILSLPEWKREYTDRSNSTQV